MYKIQIVWFDLLLFFFLQILWVDKEGLIQIKIYSVWKKKERIWIQIDSSWQKGRIQIQIQIFGLGFTNTNTNTNFCHILGYTGSFNKFCKGYIKVSNCQRTSKTYSCFKSYSNFNNKTKNVKQYLDLKVLLLPSTKFKVKSSNKKKILRESLWKDIDLRNWNVDSEMFKNHLAERIGF